MRDTALLVVHDGRDVIEETIDSARRYLQLDQLGPIFVVIDSPETSHVERIHRLLPEALMVHVGRVGRVGFAAAIRAGWKALAGFTGAVFHLEDDFVFDAPVPVDRMVELIDGDSRLAQVALVRNAVSRAEHRAGGLIEELVERGVELDVDYDTGIIRHRAFFTTNPCIYPYRVRALGWPLPPDSERKMGERLAALGYRFAFYGAPGDPPRALHTGRRSTSWRP